MTDLVVWPAAAAVTLMIWWSCRQLGKWRRRRRLATHEQRMAVYRRDGRRCANPWCRSTHELQIDHVRPWSRGGGTEVENMQVLCRACNARKGARREPWLPVIRRLWWLRRML